MTILQCLNDNNHKCSLYSVTDTFEWVDGGSSENNYCIHCSSELVEVET